MNEFKGQKYENTVIKITTLLFQLGQIAKGREKIEFV